MLKHFGFGRRRSTTKTINVVTLDGSTLPLQVEVGVNVSIAARMIDKSSLNYGYLNRVALLEVTC